MSYYFVCVPGRESEPQIAAFKEWLVRESAISQKEFDQLMLRQ